MPQVNAFFDPATYSYSYVVAEPNGCAAVIDPVLDFDPAAARTKHPQRRRFNCLCQQTPAHG